MLRTITLEGFRCFETTMAIDFGRLTVLAGVNNVGKSSVAQALMALMQSEQQSTGNLLQLSGEWVQIGSFNQTVNYARSGSDRHFSIGIDGNDGTEDIDVVWRFVDAEDPTADTAVIDRVDALIGEQALTVRRSGGGYVLERDGTEEQVTFSHPGLVGRMAGRHLLPCSFNGVLYLGAYRMPPQKLYAARRSWLGPLVGTTGEHTAEVLLKFRRSTVDILPAGTTEPMPHASVLNAWWSHIFDRPFSLRVEAAQNLGFTLSLDTPSAENLGLGQVGLGLSQVLPIVALALCSKPGDLVVVDSPEAHLHPGAQHRLMDLFVALVRAGRQVVLETHSDHLINALRLAVKRGESDRGLRPEDVAIQFFGNGERGAAVERIPVDPHGRLEKWPVGFFDQAAQTLLEIIR